ncbi:progestin and adipoQ receptor family member 4-like [Silurus asotus]|uniref:Progestin and adipoQ receptor family member 4-like n=1 Tax=Silurus asotus TaxID=30991 RepID=A0AAD5AKR4_SILAS|nr:progestin and adipoQ receptor family member 4-like [Silurus asotus]
MVFFPVPKLLDFKNSPPHLQFNRYVLTGYRPVSTCTGCLQSLFYLHNEFGNIYTHGVPFVCLLLLLPLSIPWSDVDEQWLCIVHYLACLSPTVGSVLYHIFMNHEGGARVYDALLCFDMFGVCLVNTLGALPIVHITLLCQPLARRAAMFGYVLFSCRGVRDALTAQSGARRLRSFGLQALFRAFLFFLRWFEFATGNPESLHHYVIMDALALMGGLVNVYRVPERFSPGRFDYWFNSHQIMHVAVVLAIIFLHWGTMEDLAWLKNYQCPPK